MYRSFYHTRPYFAEDMFSKRSILRKVDQPKLCQEFGTLALGIRGRFTVHRVVCHGQGNQDSPLTASTRQDSGPCLTLAIRDVGTP